MIYADFNATAPLRTCARLAMEPWFGTPANPSAVHSLGRRAAMAVDRARGQVAALLAWLAGAPAPPALDPSLLAPLARAAIDASSSGSTRTS